MPELQRCVPYAIVPLSCRAEGNSHHNFTRDVSTAGSPMAKQIKAYVEVEPYVDVIQGRGSDPATVLSSALFVDESGDALAHLAEAATGQTAPARILSGPHGCGKSTLLSVLYALTGSPEHRSRSQQAQIRTAGTIMSGTRFVPVFVDPQESASASFDDALRDAFMSAAPQAASCGITSTEWDGIAASDDPVARALATLPSGARLVLIVDGVSPWVRIADRDAVRAATVSLVRLGELTVSGGLSVLLALDEEDLESGDSLFIPLLRYFQVEYLPITALKHVCDRFILKKEARPRVELGHLYDSLVRLVPGFRWNREDFVALYPLHPSTIEVASALRRYAPSFSFPRFAFTAANRAKGRRELSLIVLDEMFDASEYELRKVPELAASFEIYDDFANNTIPKFTENQQRFWAKVVLKGLFLCSLASRSVTARDLAATMMLYEENDTAAGPRVVQSILTAFEERAAQRFVIEGEGEERSYRLPTAGEGASARVLFDIGREIAADDARIADVLVSLGAARFPDWPADLSGAAANAELEVPWRGTWRTGVLGYRVPVQLEQIPPIDSDLPLDEIDPLADLGDDILNVAAAIDGPTAAGPAVEPSLERMVVSFTAAAEICEYDWEVSLVPAGSPIELRDGPATFVLWIPGEPDDDDLQVLRRLAALRSGDPRLEAAGIDTAALQAEAEAEGGLVFHHLYLEKGRFVGPSWEARASEQAARETLGGLLARILDEPLAERYPQHPTFAGELDDAVARLLVEKFFVGGASTPNVQQAAAALAAPLGLSEVLEGGQHRFNPNSENVLTYNFNVEPLRLAEAAGENGVGLDVVYQALRREPFGLLRTAQRLVLAAMVASGRLKLTGPGGELTAAGLAESGDLEGYTRLKRAGLTVYPNEVLLEWCRLLTESEHLNDLVTADGRQLIRTALGEWLERWRELNLQARFSDVPPEAATRRTWQLIATSKQYFDTTSRSITAILDEDIPLEEGLGRIVTTFAANPTIYQRALRDLRMLTSFVDWAPFFAMAKEYVMSADRTAEPKIEAERTELVDFISAPHRLLDENKRRRFETVYETFLQDYVDYYVTSHDVYVGSRADFEALDGFLDSEIWMRFQLLSQVRIVNTRYYQFAMEFVAAIRDMSCDLPTRELLHDRPSCVCGFRLGNPAGFARMFERLRLLVEQGSSHHINTIRQFRQPLLSGLRRMQADAAYADASVPLIGLLSGNDGTELTPSTIDLINRCLMDQPLPLAVATPPELEPGQPITKDELRSRLMKWLDDLPGDEGVYIEIGRALPAVSSDE